MSDIKLHIVDNCLYWLWTWISGWQYSTNLLEVLNLIGCCILVLLFWYYELSRLFRSAYGSAIAVLRSDHHGLLSVYHPFRFACLLPHHLCYWLRQTWVLASIHGVPLVQLSMMDLRLVCCRVIRMKLSKCWECIALIYVLLPFYPFFFGCNNKIWCFLCRQKKVTGILLLIVISGSLFSACQFAYKDAKNKNAFSPYILASRFATYTPFSISIILL